MSKKSRVLNLKSVESGDSLNREICKRLKLTGWQFEKLSLEQKIEKYLDRNPDKKITLSLSKTETKKAMNQHSSRSVLQEKVDYPSNFEMGSPHNRWFTDTVNITQKDYKRIKTQFEIEYQNLLKEVEKISQYFDVIWSE